MVELYPECGMDSDDQNRLSVIADLANARRRALVIMMPFIVIASVFAYYITDDSLVYHMYNAPLHLLLSFAYSICGILMYIKWRGEVPYIIFAYIAILFILSKLVILTLYTPPQYLAYGVSEFII